MWLKSVKNRLRATNTDSKYLPNRQPIYTSPIAIGTVQLCFICHFRQCIK